MKALIEFCDYQGAEGVKSLSILDHNNKEITREQALSFKFKPIPESVREGALRAAEERELAAEKQPAGTGSEWRQLILQLQEKIEDLEDMIDLLIDQRKQDSDDSEDE